MKPISSSHFEVSDCGEALEFYHRNGWTDGLPIVPPTEEKVAINAVMAGCLSENFMYVVEGIWTRDDFS